MKNNPIRILINEKDANKRLDVVLAEKLREYTRSNLKKIIKEKNIKINNEKVTHPSTKVKIGDNVKVQNNVSIYEGVTLEDDVFLWTKCCFYKRKNS